MSVEEGVSVITVGKTTPIPAGQATSANSIPVVVASDQSPIPILDNLSAPSQVRDDLLGILVYRRLWRSLMTRTSLISTQTSGRKMSKALVEAA